MLKTSGVSIVLKIANIGLGFLVAVVLARGLGPSGYGQYSFVFAIVALMAIPARMGLPQFVVRETGRADHARDFAKVHLVWRWARVVVLVSSGIMIAGGMLTIFAIQPEIASREAFMWGFLLLPLMAMGAVRGAALRGLGLVIQGQIPESVLRPLLFLLSLLFGLLLFSDSTRTAENALILHVGAATIAFVVGTVLLIRHAPPQTNPAQSHARPDHKNWLKSALMLSAISGMFALNSNFDLIMLGVFLSDEDVGLYRVVVLASGAALIGQQAVNSVIGPQVVRLHEAGDRHALQRLVTQNVRLIFSFALGITLLLVGAGHWILDLVFGAEFVVAYPALVTLALAQLVSAGLGPVDVLLNMTGNERRNLYGLGGATLLNIVLNLMLIPHFGIIGAALATGSSIVVWNCALWWQVRIRLKLDSTAIGLPVKIM